MNQTDIEKFCRNLDWNLLFSFLIIVEEQGVTRASKRLLLSQPAVTNALKRLETHFDRPLVDRSAPDFALTKFGQLVHEEIQEVYAGVARMAEAMETIHDEVTGHVALATPTHAESPIIDNALRRFHQQNPKATLSIQVVTSGDVLTSVKRKNASCGLALMASKPTGLKYDVLYRERFALYCGPTHPLFGRDDVTLADIAHQNYVTFPTDEIGGELHDFAVARKRYGIDRPPVGRSYHLEELRRLIELGIGIGPHPVHVAQRFVEQGRLWQLPAFDDLPVFEVCLITNPRTRLNQAERAFIESVRAQIRDVPIENRSY